MSSESITIRAANVSDASALASVAEATFRDTFGPENTADDMDAFCKARYGEAIQAAEIVNPNMATLLCEQDGRLIGFAQLRFGEPPGCVIADAPGEIQRLYVTKAFHGLGAAHELMKGSLAEMSSRGRDVVWLGVWSAISARRRSIGSSVSSKWATTCSHWEPIASATSSRHAR